MTKTSLQASPHLAQTYLGATPKAGQHTDRLVRDLTEIA
jgi:hypothetical protein